MSDNSSSVSYFFLLLIIGIAIYFLLHKNSDRDVNSVQDPYIEPFTDNNIYTSNNSNNNIEIKIPKQPPIQQPTAQPIQQPLTTMDDPKITSPNIIFSPTHIDSSLFNFTPNDESIGDFDGVNLNEAFNLPLPQGTNVDAVDFKKGNMDNYNAKDFLPKEINDEWFETDFSLAKYQLNDDKLINTERYIIGINTVGQSLKNASYDIRGTIPNPKFAVSPWMNSTYEPDFNLKPLC